MKLFDDMSPTEKLDHIDGCTDAAWKHLQAEHGPVHLADIVDVWDYWVPYLLERCRKLEALAAAVRVERLALACAEAMETMGDAMEGVDKALAALGETP